MNNDFTAEEWAEIYEKIANDRNVVMKNINNEIFSDDFGVPTILIGVGSIAIKPFTAKDGYAGIHIFPLPFRLEPGETIPDEMAADEALKKNSALRIVSSNAKSIDTLIKHLKIVRDCLDKNNGEKE